MIDTKTTRNFSYGLFVLTANDGKDNGCIINTAIQVTSEPYKISIAVNKNNYTLSQILNTKVFNVSLLSQDCPFEIFTRFGFQSGKTVDKFADFPSPVSANGLKYISAKYANAFISCKVETSLDLGTHMLLVGEVTEAKVLSNVPSIFATVVSITLVCSVALPVKPKELFVKVTSFANPNVLPFCSHLNSFLNSMLVTSEINVTGI